MKTRRISIWEKLREGGGGNFTIIHRIIGITYLY